MKKIFFALPVLAIAVFLSYCAKEGAQPNETARPAADKATSRWGNCTIEISASFAVQVCGLVDFGTCTNCNGQAMSGSHITDGFKYEDVYVPDAGKRFTVRNLSGLNAVDLKIEVGGVCQTWSIPAGGCIDFALTDSCVLSSSVPGTPC